MANLKNYKFSEICAIFDEAIRSIPGYESYNPQKEIKANIHYDLTMQNVALRLNECMLTKGKKKKSERLDELYFSKLNKKPKKNAVATSIVLTLPKDYIKNKDLGITNEEYIALEKFYETDDGKKDTEYKYTNQDRILVESAKDKLMKITYTDEERKKIIKFFEASIISLEKIIGINDSDILYSIIHFDESFPHMHMAFLPMQYGEELSQMVHNIEQINMREKIDNKIQEYRAQGIDAQVYEEKSNGRIVTNFYGFRHYIPRDDERPFGCSVKRLKKAQLHNLNKDLEKELKSYGIEAKLSTGRGKEFTVTKKEKIDRREGIATEISFLELKNRKINYENEIKEQKLKISDNETKIHKLEVECQELLSKRKKTMEENERLINERRNLYLANLKLKRKLKNIEEKIRTYIEPILNLLDKINWYLACQKDKKKLAEEINFAYKNLSDTLNIEEVNNYDEQEKEYF